MQNNKKTSHSTLKLLSDQAFGESNDEIKDGLGFGTYAHVLAQAAKDTEGPFTIGIFGEWGTGKTSLMRMTEENLFDQENIITVWFNAWRFEKEEHPIVPLIATIIRAIESQERDIITDKVKKLLRSLRAVAYGFSAKSKVKVPGFAEIEASFVAKDMIEREDKLTPDPLLDRSLYYDAFEKLSNVNLGNEIKVIVLIDDLDRCFPDLAIKLLESIKLVLCQPNFIFILGVARSVIEGYLQHKYENEYGLKKFQGEAYLDKIVQLPFYIPPHTERMDSFSKRLLDRLNKVDSENIRNIMPIIGIACASNPRTTVRFVNNLLIDSAINKYLSSKKEMEEIPIEYFAISRSLQQRWQDVFSILIPSDELCVEISTWKFADIEKYAATEAGEKSQVATNLITDKNLQNLMFSKEGKAWLGNNTIRRAATQFLRSQRKSSESGSKSLYSYDAIFTFHSDDRPSVTEISKVFTKHGINIYYDIPAKGGHHLESEDKLKAVIETTPIIIFFVGKNKFDTHEMHSCIANALNNENMRKIPVLLPGSTTGNIPNFLKNIKFFDISDQEIDEKSLKPLIIHLLSNRD